MPEMSDHLGSATASDAARVRAHVVGAGRWFSGYLAVLGVASAVWIVLLETVLADGLARIADAVAWAVFIVLMSWWAERHVVYPTGATRHIWLAFATWFGMYLLIIGPLVRWQFGDSVPAWTLASIVLSLPFFLAAALILRRR